MSRKFQCTECENKDVKVKYIDDHGASSRSTYLSVRCGRCGFSWQEDTSEQIKQHKAKNLSELLDDYKENK